MNASHLKNDALDVIEESPGTIHVAHFRVRLGPINESTRCLCAPCLIGFLGKKWKAAVVLLRMRDTQSGSNSQVSAVTDQWDDGVGG